jgi:hypothetical protein
MDHHKIDRTRTAAIGVNSVRRVAWALTASACLSACAFPGFTWDPRNIPTDPGGHKPHDAAGSDAPVPPTDATPPSYGRLEPKSGETCYEFKTHGSVDSIDDSPFEVAVGDFTEQFYYRAPWPTGSVATGIATISDNAKVLQRWFLFRTSEDQPEGSHLTAPLPTLIGTDPVAVAGWSAGGANLVPPDDIGLELPAEGALLNFQWTYSNTTGEPQPDASVVQICVTPAEAREHVASVTWLGTEDLNGNVWTGGAGMPPQQISTFTTSCIPGRSDEAIHIVGYQPFMQGLGTRMQTSVERPDGSTEVLFDEPFSFGEARPSFQRYELLPGETLLNSCTFNNTTDEGVTFGTDSDNELCYQFVFSYPARALSNGAYSLLGVTDTCW